MFEWTIWPYYLSEDIVLVNYMKYFWLWSGFICQLTIVVMIPFAKSNLILLQSGQIHASHKEPNLLLLLIKPPNFPYIQNRLHCELKFCLNKTILPFAEKISTPYCAMSSPFYVHNIIVEWFVKTTRRPYLFQPYPYNNLQAFMLKSWLYPAIAFNEVWWTNISLFHNDVIIDPVN